MPLGTLLVVLCFAKARAESPLSIDDFPPPPPEIKKLIEAGNVEFATGSSKVDTRFSAETRYHIEFDYQTSIRWTSAANSRDVNIRITVDKLKWRPTHTIWIEKPPASKDFWTSQLVQHEFDHVRISTDPRIRAPFDEMTKRPFRLQHRVAIGMKPNRRQISQLVNQHIQSRFQQSLQLIDIRYQELDRLTAHGIAPIPEESKLHELLRGKARTQNP